MGWTYYPACMPIDRRYECKKQFNDNCEILKDALIGTTWYAAVRRKDTGKVFAAVFLTHIDGHDFGYKDMDESCCPCEVDCPESILKLLTPTTSQYALDWRAACREKRKSEAVKNRVLKNTAYGSVLRAVLYNGTEYKVIKRSAAHQFKTDWLQVEGQNKYLKKRDIKELYPDESVLFT